MRTFHHFNLREGFLPSRNELVTQCDILLHPPKIEFTKRNKNTGTLVEPILVKLKIEAR